MKPRFSIHERRSGVLLHPTSLPGRFGVGDLGPGSHRFLEFLAQAGQSWWQMLPVVPTGAGDSPYHSPSAFAGSWLLISPEFLSGEGLLDAGDLEGVPSGEKADFGAAHSLRGGMMRKAFSRFGEGRTAEEKKSFKGFCSKEAEWLEDFALFMAIKRRHGMRPWTEWAPELRDRGAAALKTARKELQTELAFERFLQFQFDKQWTRLRAAARERGIGLIGDVPIYVSHDSADVWANRELFILDRRGRPTVVAGVPPDYFSKTGQLWGNPIYRWDLMRKKGYRWWVDRMQAAFMRFDAIRLDHFIGFCRYFEIPYPAETAEKGKWVPGPGSQFFKKLLSAIPDAQLIAEDLGVVRDDVKDLRDEFDFPGMKVLQFAFGNDPERPSYQPHNFVKNCAVYTGTHDNDTTVGWFNDRGGGSSTRSAGDIEQEHAFALSYLGSDGREIHWDMIRLAWMSVANLAIVPMQDLLGLGTEARMNLPGTASGNWGWRMLDGRLTDELSDRLALLTETYSRGAAPQTKKEAASSSPRKTAELAAS